MKKVYKSKIGTGIVLFLVTIYSWVTYLLIQDPDYFAIGSIVLALSFTVYLLTSIRYTIEGDQLRVKAGFLWSTLIPIQSIGRISSSKSLLSAPAASLDRLKIEYGLGDTVLISPKDKETFLADICRINPAVTVS